MRCEQALQRAVTRNSYKDKKAGLCHLSEQVTDINHHALHHLSAQVAGTHYALHHLSAHVAGTHYALHHLSAQVAGAHYALHHLSAQVAGTHYALHHLSTHMVLTTHCAICQYRWHLPHTAPSVSTDGTYHTLRHLSVVALAC